jgi:hypothetical protein
VNSPEDVGMFDLINWRSVIAMRVTPELTRRRNPDA